MTTKSEVRFGDGNGRNGKIVRLDEAPAGGAKFERMDAGEAQAIADRSLLHGLNLLEVARNAAPNVAEQERIDRAIKHARAIIDGTDVASEPALSASAPAPATAPRFDRAAAIGELRKLFGNEFADKAIAAQRSDSWVRSALAQAQKDAALKRADERATAQHREATEARSKMLERNRSGGTAPTLPGTTPRSAYVERQRALSRQR